MIQLFRRLLLMFLLLAPCGAMAQTEDPFAGLASDDFDEIGAAASTRLPCPAIRRRHLPSRRCKPTICSSGRKATAGRARSSSATAPTISTPAPASLSRRQADDLAAVRVNNAVRRAIEAAMGSLTLFSARSRHARDGGRGGAASRDPAALPALDRALAQEKDPAVRRAMQQARAAAILASPDAAEADRLAAIATIRARGDMEARSVLASLGVQSASR